MQTARKEINLPSRATRKGKKISRDLSVAFDIKIRYGRNKGSVVLLVSN